MGANRPTERQPRRVASVQLHAGAARPVSRGSGTPFQNARLQGTPCLTGGTVTGTITGGAISFGAVSGQVTVTYDGSVSGNKMQGTYATGCGNAKGNWAATKK